MNHVRLSELQGDRASGVPVFAGLERATAWRGLEYLELPPAAQLCPLAQPDCEVGYLVLEGEVECAGEELAIEAESPAALLCGVGWPHTLKNAGEGLARLLRVAVALDASTPEPRALLVEEIAGGKLEWRPAIHGGAGQIATCHIWGPEDFKSPWVFLDHAVLAPRSSVGYHFHDALEESFVVRRGAGYMTIADQTFAVGPGSVTWQGIGQGHGIYNPGDQDLEFLRIAVGIRGEPFTTVDLNDDLSNRKPSTAQ